MLNVLTATRCGSRVAKRIRVAEIMDEPAIDRSQHEHALRGIARINACSFTARHLWRRLRQLMLHRRLDRLRLLDVACGRADVTIGIARLAKQTGARLELLGCDRSAVALDAARELACRYGVDCVRFHQADVLEHKLNFNQDVAISSLFLHHLDELQMVALLGRLRQVCRHAIVMDDLCRSLPGYWLARWGCRALTRSPMVHYDGPASVRSALTPDEILLIAQEAGLEGALVTRRWPERFTLVWHSPAA